MGLFSEIKASNEAERLAKVLINAINENNVDVLMFCKKMYYLCMKMLMVNHGGQRIIYNHSNQ